MDKCFADKGSRCAALEEKACNGCAFFKTKEQVNKERVEARIHNDALGIPTGQKYIDKKKEEEKLLKLSEKSELDMV